MKDKTHKPGIHENYLVTRRFSLQGLDKESVDALVEQLNILREVDKASITMKEECGVLNIAYDASIRKNPLQEIKQILEVSGVDIADSRWNRFKQQYYDFTDQNIYDTARYEPKCCNKVPPGR